MREDEMRPRHGETFHGWLARVDAPTAAYAQREHHSKVEMEAHRRGFLEGQHALLFDLYETLGRGVRDAELLVGMTAAGMLALKRARSPLDFRLAMERHSRTNDEVGEPRRPDARDGTEG